MGGGGGGGGGVGEIVSRVPNLFLPSSSLVLAALRSPLAATENANERMKLMKRKTTPTIGVTKA